MGWTKRQFIVAAFDEVGMSDYVYNMQPQDLQSALGRLDNMMAEWNARGIRLGYPLAGSPGSSDIDADTSVPDAANEAIRCNLAVRIAPAFGVTPMPETKATARKALNTLSAWAQTIPEMQLPGTTPRGAGQKPWRGYGSPFMPTPDPGIWAGDDSELDFE